jgi:hypothetical protein
MTPIRPLLFAAVALFALAGCATPEDPVPGSSAPEAGIPPKPPVAVPPPATPGDPAMHCDAKGTEWAIGQLADEALVTRVRTETHSKGVRVIKPGMAVTMDYREDRVNIDVDANNRVTKVRCG